MLNSLFDYWKSLTTLGTISLPLVGLFFLGSKVTNSINWSSPLGYYTKLRLFIKRNGGGSAQTTVSENNGAQNSPSDRYQLIQVSGDGTTLNGNNPDLIAEYPINYLGKESHWKYCFPKNSKLQKKEQQQTASSPAPTGEECSLSWYKRGSEELNYLLQLGLKFLKLQHQINLFLFYHSYSKNNEQNRLTINDTTNGNGWKDQLLQKCGLKDHQNDQSQSVLKDFFVSTSPISPHCFLVPNKVDLTLTLGSSSEQVKAESGNQTEVKLAEIKKGTIEGNIEYSFSDYYGKLHDFSWQNGFPSTGTSGQGKSTNPVLISLKPTENKKFEFKLESESTSSNTEQNSPKFEELYKKYEERELKLCDFWKSSTTSAGGGSNHLCSSTSQ